MPPKPATFKKLVIAYTEGLPPKKAEKIKGWIEHNGAKYSKELTDDVTHLIISSAAWKNYKKQPMVVEARRKRTIFLMKLPWLEDSLSLNNRKPLDEVDKKYTWEIEHAEKVLKKRKEKQLAEKKEKLRALRAEAKEAADAARNDEDDGGDDKKVQQVIDCGIKFDKSLLETEREMALAGYRPYVDNNGFAHLITPVRNDVWKEVQEHYQIKLEPSLQPVQHSRPSSTASYHEASSSTSRSTTSTSRTSNCSTPVDLFILNSNTDAHYLEDDNCCCGRKLPRKFSDSLADGHSTPAGAADGSSTISNLTQRLNALKVDAGILRLNFAHWPQHMPFSIYPVTYYIPGPGPSSIFYNEPRPAPRVHIAQPFAYSLQLYESFDRPDPPAADTLPTPESTPQSTYTSFSSYLPDSSPTIAPTSSPPSKIQSSISTAEPIRPHPSQEKRYALYFHYTKKSTSPRSKTMETIELAPKGSTWDFSYDMLKKFFRKKTGMRWEDTVFGGGNNGVAKNARRDSGVGMSAGDGKSGNVGLGLVDAMHVDDARSTPSTFRTAYSAGSTSTQSQFSPTATTDTIATTPQPFTYIPTKPEDLAYFDKRYANRYGEDWLPAPRAVSVSSQDGKIESEEMLMDTEEKEPQPDVAEILDTVEEGDHQA